MSTSLQWARSSRSVPRCVGFGPAEESPPQPRAISSHKMKFLAPFLQLQSNPALKNGRPNLSRETNGRIRRQEICLLAFVGASTGCNHPGFSSVSVACNCPALDVEHDLQPKQADICQTSLTNAARTKTSVRAFKVLRLTKSSCAVCL